jgi:hypothetical protein
LWVADVSVLYRYETTNGRGAVVDVDSVVALIVSVRVAATVLSPSRHSSSDSINNNDSDNNRCRWKNTNNRTDNDNTLNILFIMLPLVERQTGNLQFFASFFSPVGSGPVVIYGELSIFLSKFSEVATAISYFAPYLIQANNT